MMSTIYQCSHFLRCISEFTSLTTLRNVNRTWNNSHWLFGVTSDDHTFRLFNASSSKNSSKTVTTSVDIVQNLISDLIESGLNIYPQHLQQELRVLLIYLTKDCLPLISHLGDILSERLIKTAYTHGDQAHLLGPLSYNDVCLLQSSVEAILPRKSHGQLRRQPIDHTIENWEARIRPLFKILSKLSKNSTSDWNPSVPVVQNILLPLIESLHVLVSYKPNPFSSTLTSPSIIRTISQSTDNANDVQTGASGETHHHQSVVVVSNQPNSASGSVNIPHMLPHLHSKQFSHLTDTESIDFHAWLSNQPHASYVVSFFFFSSNDS
ncbi:unnamed protein product [Trichobilharzia regenti]|nr:unnamed protein product [Trichobilharzia regenti]